MIRCEYEYDVRQSAVDLQDLKREKNVRRGSLMLALRFVVFMYENMTIIITSHAVDIKSCIDGGSTVDVVRLY